MASEIVLPPLKLWAQEHLSLIIKATTQTEFDFAFDAFLSKSATITLNGNPVSRDEYKKLLQGEQFDEAGAEVTFNDAVEVATGLGAGVVGLFYTATIAESILVLGAPVQSQVTSSLNLVIEEDDTLPKPSHGIRGDFDGRRVFILNQVILDTRAPQN